VLITRDKAAVVIPTRNRGDSIVRTVRSILLNDCSDLEVIVVDQSDDNGTEISLQPLLSERQFSYIRTTTRGLSAALNVGVALAQAEIIAITNDDCEAHKDWLKELDSAFAIDARIGIVFGNVLPGPHDRSLGFVPAYVRDTELLAWNASEKHNFAGTTACMGVRRSVWQVLGGFDEMFGKGAPLHSAEDLDLTLRALLKGHAVYETPRVSVVHHGFYRQEQRAIIVHQYWYGTGAAFAKQLKCGRWSMVKVLLRLMRGWIFRQSRIADSLGKPPRRMQFEAFLRGFIVGAFISVNRSSGHYILPRTDADWRWTGLKRPRAP
jgi:GT2 family glycosyltransferase